MNCVTCAQTGFIMEVLQWFNSIMSCFPTRKSRQRNMSRIWMHMNYSTCKSVADSFGCVAVTKSLSRPTNVNTTGANKPFLKTISRQQSWVMAFPSFSRTVPLIGLQALIQMSERRYIEDVILQLWSICMCSLIITISSTKLHAVHHPTDLLALVNIENHHSQCKDFMIADVFGHRQIRGQRPTKRTPS